MPLNLNKTKAIKDLVLREYLAIERTRLANETTLLAYIRTGTLLPRSWINLGRVNNSSVWKIGTPLIVIGLVYLPIQNVPVAVSQCVR